MSDESIATADESTAIETEGDTGGETTEATETIETEGNEDTEGVIDTTETDTTEEGEREEGDTEEVTPEIITVNGQQIDITNISPEQRTALLQKGLSADEKFQEAANIRTKAANLVNALKNPATTFETLKALGLDDDAINELAENRTVDVINREKMTDEERELHDLREERKQWKTKSEEEKKTQEDAEYQKGVEELSQGLQNRTQEFYEANKDITPDVGNSRIIINLLGTAHKEGMQLTDTQIKGLMQEEIASRNSYFANLTPEQLDATLPKEVREKYRQLETKEAKAVKGTKPATQGGKPRGRREKESFDEYMDRMDREINELPDRNY